MSELTSDKSIFIPFSKVDVVKREVSGIVTAEQPDKDLEVCDYEKSKPYYKAVIQEIGKATDGKNFFPLRYMHQLDAVGKCIGFNFNDSDKEIEMTFKVVDEEAWKKVDERVLTGFSQGGRKVGDQVPDPVHKGCMRYVANPSEISLVDNPCLASAHFAYVKADGQVEMRKFLKTVESPEARIAALEKDVSLLKAGGASQQTTQKQVTPPAELIKKTKRVGGKDLQASAFAFVGDPEKTETWKLPIHDKAHAQNALARFNQTQGIPPSAKAKVKSKIVAAAKKFGIDVASENEKIAAIADALRKGVRIYVNRNYSKVVSPRLLKLDSELGKLAKGMYEVESLAGHLDCLSRLLYCVCCEQEWEGDDSSELPEMLAQNLIDLAGTLVEMVDEETREMIEEARMHVA
jgi:hypothetical protein